MKRYSYGERDYAFGQMMLTLRTSIGLTQAGLADLLGVSRHAVAEWEAGSSYPKAEHLKQVIALGVQQQAFPSGHEAEEIRALWRAAHQKVLLDESWLAALLGKQHPPLALMGPLAVEQTSGTDHVIAPPALGPRVDWGDALAVSAFHGRKPELALLTEWVVQERCRVVSVLGMGGIGKSALAVSLMHQVAPHFEVVIWRPLRDSPAPEALLDECLQVLAPHPLADVPTSLERRLSLLLEYLREPACAPGAGQPGGAAGRRRGHWPHACRLRGLRTAAAPGSPDRAPELSAAHLAGETERTRAPGGQPNSRYVPCASSGLESRRQ